MEHSLAFPKVIKCSALIEIIELSFRKSFRDFQCLNVRMVQGQKITKQGAGIAATQQLSSDPLASNFYDIVPFEHLEIVKAQIPF